MTAVILLAHGSPDPRSASAARRLATSLQRRMPGFRVDAAFLQHDTPTLGAICESLVSVGVARAIVVPVFLSNAFHTRVDVPQAMADARADSNLALDVTAPIGPDDALLGALDRSLPPGPVVLATAGTTDPEAQGDFERLAAAWAGRRCAPVAVGYASQAEPSVATAIAGVEARTGQQTAVACFVLFPGILPDRIAAAAGGRTIAGPLHAEVELLDVLEKRVRASLTRAA